MSYEPPESAYDRAVQALAPYLPDGWVAFSSDGDFEHFEDKPFLQEADENWNPHWRTYGISEDSWGLITVPRPSDWRTSLRRIEKGKVVG